MQTNLSPSPPRPRRVTLLCLGVLIIVSLNLTRLILTIKNWDFLAGWSGVSPLYIALTGLVWTLAGLPLLWGLWRGLGWAPRLMKAVALTYALYYWLDHIFLVDHPLNGATGSVQYLLPINWPFAAGVTAILLGFTYWTLNRPAARSFFGEAEDIKDNIEE